MKRIMKKANKMSVEAYACSCPGCSCSTTSCGTNYTLYYQNYDYMAALTDAYGFQFVHQNGGM